MVQPYIFKFVIPPICWHLDKPYRLLLANSTFFFHFAVIVIAFYYDITSPSLFFVCSLSRSRWTKSCAGSYVLRSSCPPDNPPGVRPDTPMMIWNLAVSVAILRALQLVNSRELKVAICISPKKMASCIFYLFVMFFYLFTRFS